MIKRKKGFTIIELVVSICLISLVMLFMYELLNDIKFEGSSDYIATGNASTRIEIEDVIHNYLSGCSYIKRADVVGNRIDFIDTDYSLIIKEDNITLMNLEDTERQWKVKNATFDTSPICTNSRSEDDKYGLVSCDIKVYTKNSQNTKDNNNNNTLDDIIISYVYDSESERIVDSFELIKSIKVNNHDTVRTENQFSYDLNDRKETKKEIVIELENKYTGLTIETPDGRVIEPTCSNSICKYTEDSDTGGKYVIKATYRDDRPFFTEEVELHIAALIHHFAITVNDVNIVNNANMGSMTYDCIENETNTYEVRNYNGYSFKNYSNGSEILTIKCTQDETFTANYDYIDYNIIYELNGGTNNSANPSTFNIGNYNISLNNPSRVGYTFNGWFIDDGLINKIENINQVVNFTNGNASDITVYAGWTEIQYTISFRTSGYEKIGTSSLKVAYGSSNADPSIITLAQNSRVVYIKGLATYTTGATISSTDDIYSTAPLNGYFTLATGGTKVLEPSAQVKFVSNVSNYTDKNGNWIKASDTTLYPQFGAYNQITLPTITKKGYSCGWGQDDWSQGYSFASGEKITPRMQATLLYGVCTPNNFTINLDKNDGNATGTTELTVKYDEKFVYNTVTAAAKTATFRGFTTSSTLQSNGATISSIAGIRSEAKIKGYFTQKTGGTKLIGINGATLVSDPAYTASQEPVLMPNVAGLTDANGNWIKDGDVTVYAQFESQPSITFPTITKTGYTCGWTTNANGTSIEYSSGQTITPTKEIIDKDVIDIYGICKAQTLTITLSNVGTPSNVTTSLKASFGSNKVEPTTMILPTKTYTVSGFTLGSSASGASVSDNSAKVSSLTFKGYYTDHNSGSLVIKPNSTISYNPGASDYTDASGNWIRPYDTSLYAHFDSPNEIQLPSITKAGYDCGWATSSNVTTFDYASGSKMTPSGDTTLYGVCNPKGYTITLSNIDSSSNATKSLTVYYGTSTISPSTIVLPTKKYIVRGFTNGTTATGATVSSTTSITSTASLTGYYTSSTQYASGQKVIDASTTPKLNTGIANYTDSSGKWIKQADVTLHAQYGYGSTITLPKITKSGYTCGWATSSSATAIAYSSGSQINPSSDMTLYGVCIANDYTITYKDQNGNTISTQKYSYSSTSTKLLVPNDTDYVYYGWYTTSSLTGTKYTTLSAYSTGDKTYYANKVKAENISSLSNSVYKGTYTYRCPNVLKDKSNCTPETVEKRSGDIYKLTATVKEISYNIKTNTSVIEYSLAFTSSGGFYYTSWMEQFNLFVNGKEVPESDKFLSSPYYKVSFSSLNNFNENSVRVFGTMTINHDDSGNASVSFYGVRDTKCSRVDCCSSEEWKSTYGTSSACHGNNLGDGYYLPAVDLLQTSTGTVTLTTIDRNYIK